MATVALTPDPQKFPNGSKVHFFVQPPTPWQQTGKPPGSEVVEVTVTAGVLTVTGVSVGTGYVGWFESGGTDRYVNFFVPPAESSSGTSVAEVEALIAEKAVSTASPAFTGVPTAPTASALTKTTQLATTAFGTDAVAVEKSRAETAEALKAALASPTLTGTPAAPTAAALTNTTQIATTAFALGEVTTEKTRAETAEALKAALASPALTGTPTAPTAAEGTKTTQVATTAHVQTATVDHVMRTICIPAGQVPGNEQYAAWEIKLYGTEKRTLIRARIRCASGTIKVAIKRGEAGETEIAAYKELKGAETQEVVESEQALSDKDRITVTGSGGSSPKGLFIDIWEKVEK